MKPLKNKNDKIFIIFVILIIVTGILIIAGPSTEVRLVSIGTFLVTSIVCTGWITAETYRAYTRCFEVCMSKENDEYKCSLLCDPGP